ncbi:MGH1-like glycoside hydrolase domain-containing protein [Fimbriiglobus ruber]|uniref:Glucosidase n=1 Tax=Fimbriiglobus ruber TaxID=1908690 RepID=A0A225DZQ5_9BACT|nr:glucosidase [Fimbriiglobus ruber]OWK46782.1 glucosidase [Fimbriiglobus ruber]
MPPTAPSDPEAVRLAEDARREKNWKRWGPYLSERQWGTVREDYSANGDAWAYFPHDHARSRAYRWAEDGLLGITDRECRLCFALALWNGIDPILKERLFGLANEEGNHGEDVKELYYYLDATPTHSYLKGLYKYPQGAFPYTRLIEENHRRGRTEQEFELADTGAFDGDKYWDVTAEYAKASPNDILIRLTVINRGPAPATLHLLPTLWFRNTWCWGSPSDEGKWAKPHLSRTPTGSVLAEHQTLGRFSLTANGPGRLSPDWLFTDNETDTERVFGVPNKTPYIKDAFHEYLIRGQTGAVNPTNAGTKAAAVYRLDLPASGTAVVDLRLRPAEIKGEPFGPEFDGIFADRVREADAFYAARHHHKLATEEQKVVRQAYAGLLWSQQFYHFIVSEWLDGDPSQPAPPPEHKTRRNADWRQLFNRDVVLMPDKWEYPWYAAWDLAFHCVAIAEVDPEMAKGQLLLFLREWYMHPSGQLPAYEWNFNDTNPPVHAWACWRVYKITGPRGGRDRAFLEQCFHKLLLSFTWWVNRKDPGGRNLFAGGFLGLDNIGPFDRSKPLPGGCRLQQADGTAWMAFFCLTMLAIAIELAATNPAYEGVASKFFEHFIAIADAMNTLGGTGLWDETDGFYYDRLEADGHDVRTKVRSMVGLIPLIAAEVLEDAVIDRLPSFKKRMRWLLDHRPDLAQRIAYLDRGGHGRRLLALPSRERLARVVRYLFDEAEFFSPFGVRSMSRFHRDHPYVFAAGGQQVSVRYEPAESPTGMFGGNSNWRGPVWFPVNYLLIEALEKYHHFYGDDLLIEVPTGSGRRLTLRDAARELSKRLIGLFVPGPDGRRPCHGNDPRLATDPHWRDFVTFYEYFDGDTGRGLGANHQTGWTALVARMIENGRPTPPTASK